MWDVLLLFSSICTAVVVGAPVTVTGFRGETLNISCPYKPEYETDPKYFCKGECLSNKNIMVKSGSPAKDERFSLTDDTTARVFTVTITDLRTEDEGQYWCAVDRKFARDDYSEILLLVKQDKSTTEISTVSYVSSTLLPPQTPLSQTSSPDTGSFAIIIAGVLVFLLLGAVLLVMAARRIKQISGGPISSTEGLHRTLRKGEENDYDEGNSAVLPNPRTAQSHHIYAANEFHRPVNTEPDDADRIYMNTAAPMTSGPDLDQIYTELDACRQSDIYQTLTAGFAREDSIYHSIDRTTA